MAPRWRICPRERTLPSAGAGQRLIDLVIRPDFNFGTGGSPLTRLMLQQLPEVAEPLPKNTPILDIGCGSGILAIACAKLGFRPVHATDTCADARAAASDNARRNRVAIQVTAQPTGDIRYGLILANFYGPMFDIYRDAFRALLTTDGLLLCAGFDEAAWQHIETAYRAAGLQLVRTAGDGWRCALWRRVGVAE